MPHIEEVSSGTASGSGSPMLAMEGGDAIAIVGMACTFPQEAENPEKFWQLLLHGRSALTDFPAHKINIDAHYHPDPAHGGTMSCRQAHFLKDSGYTFDAPFFNISKTEAMTMDPQQRLLMENVYEALENAGIPMEAVRGSATSVFVGAFTNDFQTILNEDSEAPAKYAPTGNSNSILSNRVSWFYDLSGCSLTLDTACSSSLVAVHLACENLRAGAATMSIVGGVNVIEQPQALYRMSKLGFLSPDGKCFSFDHRANGYSRGEGVGVVVLKPLSKALQDGNTIRAVIHASGVNQDGRTPGMTVPSQSAQEALIRSVYTSAGLDLSETDYVEAHGTGTPQGDPIEARAIAAAWRSRTSPAPLYVGAVKTNIGHLEGASGVAGVIKAVLALENAVIPPNINFERCNPKISPDEWKIKFPTMPTPWPDTDVRRASINSFGFGGTNAHVVIDDAYNFLRLRRLNGIHRTVRKAPDAAELDALIKAPSRAQELQGEKETQNGASDGASNGSHGNDHANVTVTAPPRSPSKTRVSYEAQQSMARIFVVSASDQGGIKRVADTYSVYFAENCNQTDEMIFLDDLAYTLAERRSLFPWRSALVAASTAELVKRLPGLTTSARQVRGNTPAKMGFVFTGQGAQWPGMGKALLCYEVFWQSLWNASTYLQTLGCSWNLIDELVEDAECSRLDNPELSQAACTALQVALVDLMRSWNVLPSGVVGHSSGEIAAAYCSGSLSREEAWEIAYYRGVVSARLAGQGGTMMATRIAESDLRPYLDKLNQEPEGELTVACYNSPCNLTVSGTEAKLERLADLLQADKIPCKKLNVRNAYHSAHMAAVADEYRRLMADSSVLGDMVDHPVAASTSRVAMFSSVTGAEVSPHKLRTPDYWVDNLLSPVRFSQSLLAMCSPPQTKKSRLQVDRGSAGTWLQHLVEIGPHPALRTAASETLAQDASLWGVEYHALLRRGDQTADALLSAMAKLFCSGHSVDLLAVNHASSHAEKNSSRRPEMLVNLPPYPFNHTQTYWPESRLSRNLRFRPHPRLDLLGAPVSDWNSNEPRWRQILRVSENPWLKDHQVTGRIVYPGVGFIVMAIEAARQLHEAQESKITGFCLRDISIRAALQVPETEEGVEVMLSMPPSAESSLGDSSTWRQFKLASYNPSTDGWTEHCRGMIKAEIDSDGSPFAGRQQANNTQGSPAQDIEKSHLTCRVPFDMERAYAELETIGLSFGALFRNLSNVWHNGRLGGAVGRITVPDAAAAMPKRFIRPHLIHPATMDSMLHLFLAALQNLAGQSRLTEPMLPVFIREVRVAKALDSRPGAVFVGHATAQRIAHKKFRGSILAWGEAQEPLVRFGEVDFIPLQSSMSAQNRQLSFNMEWKQDMDFMGNKECERFLQESLKPTRLTQADVYRMAEAFNLASVIYITEALESLGGLVSDALPAHLQRYLAWVRYQADRYREGKILHQRPQWQMVIKSAHLREKLLEEVEKTGPEGRLTNRMGTNIVPVLRQEVDALQLMFGDDLLDAYYRELHGTEQIHQLLRSYLELHTFKHANLKVLEIGAGTGGTTLPALETLCPLGGFPRVAKYTYTDISPGFFEKAKAKFRPYLGLLEFCKLDIEKDPLTQGFGEQQYDVVIASNVLHATADISKTLANVRKLLRTGGILLLQEAVNPHLLSGPLAFGTLPGWWLGREDSRRLWPILDESQWDVALRDCGFAGAHMVLKDHVDPNIHAQSLIAAVADGASPTALQPQLCETVVTIIPHLGPSRMTAEIEALLRDGGVREIRVVEHDEWLDEMDVKTSICIVLRELEAPVFRDISELDFHRIRKVLTTCRGLLWVTGNTTRNPDLAISTGLVRSLRWERDLDDSNLVTVALDARAGNPADVASHVVRIFEYQFRQPCNQRHAEYRVDSCGTVWINRLVNGRYLDDHMSAKLNVPVAVPQALGTEPGRALKLATDCPSLLNRLQFVDCPVHPTPLNPNDVEVSIAATGLNFRDIMSAMGEVAGEVLGAEGAGTVTRIGAAVTRVAVGDRVALLASHTGCFATLARTVDAAVVRLPDHVSLEEAAGLPVIACTAYYSLVNLARLKRGESILIHSAAGGVGQAAVMLSRHIGAEVFVTVSSQEKKAVLMETYGIPDDHVLYSRDLAFGQDIARLTGGRGVDVVLNSLAGEALRVSWNCVAPFGRFIEIGKRDIYANGRLEMFPFSRNITFASCDLETVMKLDQTLLATLLQDTMQLWQQGVFRPTTPMNVFPYSQIESSFRLLQSGRHIGKVVLTASKEDVVPVIPRPLQDYRFPQDASYVLAGGFGGLGRSIAKWMASRGARSFIFLSRTVPSSESTLALLTELQRDGCETAVFSCDISNEERLKQVIKQCTETMQPIKGCIQLAMQLRDSALETMTYSSFISAILPKVHGSFNLHNTLPDDLDFFIMFSSICGLIGNRGQSNYAAGNTYQDALAHFRRQRGQAASTIDLGSMLSVGFIAEHADTVNPYALAAATIREDELHTILEYHVDPQHRDAPAQVAVGLATKGAFAKKGIPEPSFLRHPLFALLQCSTEGFGTADGEEESFAALRAALRAAKAVEDAAALVVEMIVKRLSSVMALATEDIDPSKPVHYYGVDSLVAMEFRNWLAKNLEADIEVLDIMGDGSIAQLGEKIVCSSKLLSLGEGAKTDS